MGVDLMDVKLHVSPRVVFVVNGVVEVPASVTQVCSMKEIGLSGGSRAQISPRPQRPLPALFYWPWCI